jgi:hypothetical protein
MGEEKEENQEKPKKERELLEEPVPVKDIILMYLYTLEGKAWAYLGLTSHPETGKPKKDLAEAKIAIDAIESLLKIVEIMLSPDEKKEIRVQLTNLRLNFAGK